MRKATLISGIIGLVLIVVGTYLVISKIQPHGGLLAIAFAETWLVFLPLMLVYRLKNDKTKFQKLVSVVGFIVGWLFLFPGLFFGILRWPGGAVLNLAGMVFGFVFFLLFIFANKPTGITPVLKGAFTILVAAMFVMLAGGRQVVLAQQQDETEQSFVDYNIALTEERRMVQEADAAFSEIMAHPDDTTVIRAAQNLHRETVQLLKYIYDVRAEVVSRCEGVTKETGDTLSVEFIRRPGDFDTPTHYFIGNDPRNVSGTAKDISSKLTIYLDQNYSRSLNVKSVYPQPYYSEDNDKQIATADNLISWECKNFYHKTLIESLTALLNTQTAVLRAEKEALEKKEFKR